MPKGRRRTEDRPDVGGPSLRRALRSAADFLLPPACAGCGACLPPREAERRVCGRCRARLRPPPSPRCPRCGFPRGTGRLPGSPCPECHEWPSHIRCLRSAVVLEPPADALVHRLKYGGWRELAPLLARRMARVRLPGDVDAEARRIVPVPTTTKRLRRRGYNQAEVLGRAYARETGRRVITALVRRGEGGTQVSLQPSERRANVADAFTLAAGSRRDVRGRHVLLVDDVLTTGATALAAAGTLVSGGCRRVSVVTFARALPGRSD